jgi:hypothetical protein
MTDSNNITIHEDDSDVELSNEDGGSGEDGTDGNNGSDDTPKKEDQPDSGKQNAEPEDIEVLKKRFKDTQDALRIAKEELKKKSGAGEPKAGKVDLTPEMIEQINENVRVDERFFSQNPELERQKELLRDLRATKFTPTTPLSEVALRYGLVEQEKVDAARSRTEKGTVVLKSKDPDDIPDFKKDPVGYDKWSKIHLNRRGGVYNQIGR